MTPDKLSALTEVWREAQRHEREMRVIRDTIIARALRSGMAHRAIAEAVGVTYGRVGQIAAQRAD